MLAAGSPSSGAFGITERRFRLLGGRLCLELPPHARSMSGGSWAAGRMDRSRASMMRMGKKVEAETIRSGEDLLALGTGGSSARKKFPEHLVVMVNGLVGSAEDWRFAAEQLISKLYDKVIVHRSACNSSRLTFDGVDFMGERLADELKKDGNRQDGIAGLEAMNFITFASPHLGSRGHKQLPFLCGLPFLEQRASEAAHLIVGRTGKHLFLTDNDDGRPPLLLRMVHDCDDIKFMSALSSFKRRVAYSNANYDHMVGWRTSSIRRQQELPKYHLLAANEKYQHIVHVDRGESKNAIEEVSSDVLAQKYDLEEEMIQGLTQVPWERVDVSFQKSRQRYVAHNTIQVKSYWLNLDGADVVSHMIDNFLA